MRRDDQAVAGDDLVEIHARDRELAIGNARRLRQIDGHELVFLVALDPFAIPLGRAAEEDDVAVFELVVGDGKDDSRLVADRGQRAGGGSGAVEEDDLVEGKRALAKGWTGFLFRRA